MSTPTDHPSDELRALRERAYGRDADIHDDPVALARLSELEAQAAAASIAASTADARVGGNGAPTRSTIDEAFAGAAVPAEATLTFPGTDAAPTGTPHAGDAPTPVAGRTGDDGSVASASEADPSAAVVDHDAADPESPDAAAASTGRPWWRRRIPVLWAASLVAALLLGAGLTLLLQNLEAGKVGVLQVDPDAEWPEQVWGGPTEDSRGFEPFYGLSVLSQPQRTGSGAQEPVPCIVVFSGVGENPSYLGGACGAGPFPAEAAMVVDRMAPSELRERFPDGTALQFVLDGEQVHVYAREPVIVQPAP